MHEDYHNFDLDLTWHKGEMSEIGRVSVKYPPENLSGGPTPYSVKSSFGAINQLSELMSSNINKEKKISELIEAGRQIADLLLPKGAIRKQFRNFWRNNNSVRLRLIYAGDDDGIKQLLKIPWEYVYLKKQDEDKDDIKYFLGLRDDISIVHCLKQIKVPAEPPQASVNRLKVEMKYFSCLGLGSEGLNADDNRIFQNFLDEFDKLKTIINCSNISDSASLHIKAHKGVYPKPYDVIMALRNDDFIHLTCHGEPDEIWLKDSGLTSHELLNQFKLSQDKVNAKVVILLSCNSGDGARSIAAALHQIGVPIVIGMTRWIRIEDAGRFVDGFYKAIAIQPSQGLEKAIIQGRLSMLKEGVIRNEWYAGFGLPRLFLNSSHSVLINEKSLFGSGELINRFDNYINRLIAQVKTPEVGSKLDTKDYQTKLEDWVQEGATKWFFVSGKLGSSKSTQIALLLHRFKEVINPTLIYHFCLERPLEIGNLNGIYETSDPLAFVRDSLVPQLAERFGEKYYRWCPPGKFPLLTYNTDDALLNFVYLPLLEAKKENEENLPVIVIDGIDVIPPGRHRHDSILGLLLRHRDSLSKVARFLVTADAIDTDETTAEEAKSIIEDIYRLTHHHDELPDLVIC